MRTTIEVRDDHRAKLLEMAAQRGEKGFSSLVQEALDRFFEQEEEREARARKAISVLGTIDDEEAAELEASVREIRGRWR